MALFYYDRETQFSESNAAGIIHFSKIACYVEEAEHAFLKQAGYPLDLHNPESLRWPRVQYKASYSHPLFPFQKIRVFLDTIYVGRSSINWKWSIVGFNSKVPLCDGEMKTVCCLLRSKKMEINPLPDELRAKLISS